MRGGGRIRERFAVRASEGRAALIPYVTAGFPEPASTIDVLSALADAGADVIELGVPFSDPLADGPTIQASSFAALENGMTMGGVLRCVSDFRAGSDVPVVIFSYLNPILRFGDGFCDAAREAGADGLLVTDLPAGADPELEEALSEGGLDLIRLIAPTTAPGRFREVARGGRGFLYYISRTGVTGARDDVPPDLESEVARVKAAVDLPVAVGFGISTPAQAAAVGRVADGVVVGSALVRALGDRGVEAAGDFAASLRRAMDDAVTS